MVESFLGSATTPVAEIVQPKYATCDTSKSHLANLMNK